MTNPHPFRQTWADDFFTSRAFPMVRDMPANVG